MTLGLDPFCCTETKSLSWFYSDPFFSVCFLAALAPFLAAVLAAALVLVFLTDPLGRPLPLLAAGADSVLVGAMLLSEKEVLTAAALTEADR